MEAFFFGPRLSQLLGVYHPADIACDRYQGVVLCYPFGQEYMRAHRAYRQLATSLARKGFHVLRFDYRGTGDSAGELTGVTAADWVKDIECAVRELKDMTGVRAVTLVGLRLGALLAGVAVVENRHALNLVVWDPVVSGDGYVRDLVRRMERSLPHKRRSNFRDRDGNLHFNGFYMPPAFQTSLSQLSLLECRPDSGRVLQVVSHDSQEFNELMTAWSGLGGFEYRHVPAEHDWNYVDHVGGILMPQPVLQTLVDWM